MWDVYFYVFIYSLFLMIISYYVSRGQGREGFLIAGRTRKGWQILCSKFALMVGAPYFITYTGFAYEYGFGILAMLFGSFVGYLAIGYWAAPKIYDEAKGKKFYTLGDFVYGRTNDLFSLRVSNFLSNIISFIWLLLGVIGGAKIIEDFGILSYSVAVFLVVFVVFLYVFIAGFKAVIITDVIQSFVIILLLILVTFGIVGNDGVFALIGGADILFDFGSFFSFFLVGLFLGFSSSSMFQLCYSSKTKNGLRHGIGLSVFPILLVSSLLFLIGIFMSAENPSLDSGMVFTQALSVFLPNFLLPFGIVLFFAGIMSSADTNIYSISSHYVLNRKRSISVVSMIRFVSAILVLLVSFFALIFRDIIDISVVAVGVSLTLSVPIIYLLFGGKNSRRFLGSIFGAIFGFVLGLILFGAEPLLVIFVLIGSILGLFWHGGFR